MCGIVGIFKFNGEQISEFELKSLTSSVNHRGPDGSGIFIDNNKRIGLGHTRTRTFDLSDSGHQPMSYLGERYWITFNGDIYNFIELKQELKSLGCTFKSNSDTELILAAYSQWGEQCQFKFNGDWAFAIWDDKRKNLFLSSDRFGTKPFYYIRHKDYFIFASELKAFMSLNERYRPDFDYGFLLWQGKNQGCINTFLKEVILLPGGHQINIDEAKSFKLKKWWKTIDHLVEPPKNYRDQVDRYRELFFESCRIRLRSDVPIASCLSGGIDSSSVVSTIARIKEEGLNVERDLSTTQNVFICDFNGDKSSERRFANAVIANYDIIPTFIDIDSSIITPEDLIKVHLDHEGVDVDAIWLSLLHKRMREKNIRISIDGTTPDETLGGYWEDPEIAMKDAIWPWSEKGRFNDLQSIREGLTNYKLDHAKYKIMLRILLGDKTYNYIQSIYYKQKNKLSNNIDRYHLIAKSKRVYPIEDEIGILDNFNSHLYKEFHYYKTPYFLQRWDKVSMAHGVISRSPFIDPNLISYIFSLPSRAKIGGGYTKRILRDSMRNIVPNRVLNRKDKKGFSSPPNWYEKNMREYMLDRLSSTDLLQSNIFDGAKLKEDYENNLIAPGPNGNPSKKIFRIIQLMELVNSFKQIYKSNRQA